MEITVRYANKNAVDYILHDVNQNIYFLQFSTYGLDEYSYVLFKPLDATTNDISVTFATTKPDSLLVYNFGKAAGGRSDFIALELVDGKPRLSWGGSRTGRHILFGIIVRIQPLNCLYFHLFQKGLYSCQYRKDMQIFQILLMMFV